MGAQQRLLVSRCPSRCSSSPPPWAFPAALPVPPELPEAQALPALPLSAVLLGVAVARASCCEQCAATCPFRRRR